MESFKLTTNIVIVVMAIFTAFIIGCDQNDEAGQSDTGGQSQMAGGQGASDDGHNTVVFIHHSVGETWVYDGGLDEDMQDAGIDLFEITYGDGWFGDNTFTEDLPITFGQYYSDVLAWQLSGGAVHDIVMIKSCFPDSLLWDGDITAYQEYYNQIGTILQAHPETGFIVMTPPPYTANEDYFDPEITNGRMFAHWLKNEWAANRPNVRVVDLAGYLNDDQGFMHQRTSQNAGHFYLRGECELDYGDSHPTGNCLAAANSETVNAASSLLDFLY